MRRIKRDVTHEEFIKSLIDGDPAIFGEIWRVLLFAAAIGVKMQQREPLGKVDAGKAFPENFIGAPGWRGFLYLLGFCDNDSGEHLKNDEPEREKLITAFEEYANFGLYELKRRITSSTDILGQISEFIIEQTNTKLSSIELDDISEGI